ncbi:hypothetical protein BO94DRAFT_128472 [Aspergillus sclerotioniger CBS 115572]|uniref:Uncharacterized protein n=1 Tax=Aspergillus sclerotioniger CBS 115572 TaxID=1450535 RepID=A0A317XFI3_9EURO|nr:hypothetical protein BO94DRAFT_128472 [Aspergillus sclerotioniger CBS 115572]PWY95510.1 hypothetical protein BO94DRAFT_128472 [Aspergillus sclerotioniger CBS 115572]
MHMSVPLFLVNHEAYATARRWIYKQGSTIRFHWPTDPFLFLRRCHPASDTLYVPGAQYHEFIREPESETFGDGPLRYRTALLANRLSQYLPAQGRRLPPADGAARGHQLPESLRGVGSH